MTPTEIDKLKGQKGIYETVTPAQNLALMRLVSALQNVLAIPQDQVCPHARVFAKNLTEASTAQWQGKK